MNQKSDTTEKIQLFNKLKMKLWAKQSIFKWPIAMVIHSSATNSTNINLKLIKYVKQTLSILGSCKGSIHKWVVEIDSGAMI